MNETLCSCVGIDVSKGKSTIAVMRPFGEIVLPPFEVRHTPEDLKVLADTLRSIEGDVRIVMEYTGKYYQPIALYLYDSGFFVNVTHAKIIHDFANNTIRQVKTDKADAVKIANYGLSNWPNLKPYTRDDDTRLLLKTYNRQYNQCDKQLTACRNNLISLLDQTLPGLNELYPGNRHADGHIKWVDVAYRFWHCQYITSFSLNKFTELYNSWCKRHGYRGSAQQAENLYQLARNSVPCLPKNEATKQLIRNAANNVILLSATVCVILSKMDALAKTLPEYPVVMSLPGVGKVFGPQLIAEIGDVRRFTRRSNLIAFAGLDAPPYQSGKFESRNRHISKRGSTDLRKVLFLVIAGIQQRSQADEAILEYILRKRAEGKPYYVYMVAGCNKFLRLYYAKVKAYLNELDQ